LKWNNSELDAGQLNEMAIEAVRKRRGKEEVHPRRVFLLGSLYPTNFKKDTPGGMWGSKKYFNVSNLHAGTPEELANVLRDKVWSQLARDGG
jgi:hypothetical protein